MAFDPLQSFQRYEQYPAYPTTAPPAPPTAPARQWPFEHDMQYSHSAFCDPPADFFPAPSQLVGYPESSQRTLLQESAYSTAYAVPFADGIFADDATHAQLAYDARPRARPADADGEHRPAFAGSTHLMHARAGLESAHRLLPQPALHPMLHVFPNIAAPHAPAFPAAGIHDALPELHAPRMPAYGAPPRRHSTDSLPDPLSPSAVPPLVYDADTGEEYDDDSESSPASAASELARAPYHPAPPREERLPMEIAVPGEWGGAYAAHEFGAHAHAARARTPRGDSYAAAHAHGYASSASSSSSSASSSSTERPKAPQKKSKMHQCTVCNKLFPRPSGLATHMNSHSGAKPYKCPIPTCTKSFAVRSNAKRHLRTHGIFPSAEHASPAPSQFTVGFDTPLVSEVHDVGRLPPKLRWVPQSLAARTNVDALRAPDDSSDDDDFARAGCPLLPVPLPPVVPSRKGEHDDAFEERDSYAIPEQSPYLPSQWRALPGPAIVSANNF